MRIFVLGFFTHFCVLLWRKGVCMLKLFKATLSDEVWWKLILISIHVLYCAVQPLSADGSTFTSKICFILNRFSKGQSVFLVWYDVRFWRTLFYQITNITLLDIRHFLLWIYCHSHVHCSKSSRWMS